jgi:hypothetical protein
LQFNTKKQKANKIKKHLLWRKLNLTYLSHEIGGVEESGVVMREEEGLLRPKPKLVEQRERKVVVVEAFPVAWPGGGV